MKQTDLAYLAGIVDGEGCIDVFKGRHRSRPFYILRLSITNTDQALLRWLKRSYQGSITCQRRSKRPTYAWSVYGLRAKNLLREISPFLMVKRAQAEIALTMPSRSRHDRSRPLTRSELDARKRIQLRLKSLRSRL